VASHLCFLNACGRADGIRSTTTAMPSSAAPTNEPYVYQRPSTMSTRAIISDANTPKSSDTAPEHHTPSTHPAHSQTQHQHPRSANYAQALTDRAIGTTSDSSSAEPKVVAGLAYRGDNADSTSSRPGVLGRQQSWKSSDQKRVHMERMLSSDSSNAGGYTSTGKQ